MQNVIEKILDEAKKEAEAIARKYESEVDKIKQEYQEKIANVERKLSEEIKERKKKEIMQAIAQTNLEYNKKLTTEMQICLENVLQSAIKKLPEHKKYLDFLKGLIRNSGVKEGELYLSKSDLQKYQTQIEEFIKQENYNFILNKDDKISGGIIIKKDKTTFLGSVNVIIEVMKEELKINIARILGLV